jgi:hypothetical protein
MRELCDCMLLRWVDWIVAGSSIPIGSLSLSLSLFAIKFEAFSSESDGLYTSVLKKTSCGAASCFHLPTFVFVFWVLFLPAAYIS